MDLKNRYLKYKNKYLQLGGKISLWGYIQNIISNLSSQNKIIANTILPSLGLSFDNLSYKNYPNEEDGSLLSRRTEFIKLLQTWRNNNLNIHTILILDMYKNDLSIIKTEVVKLTNDNLLLTKDQENKLFPYLKKFYNDILEYCDNEIIENVLITWFKTTFNYLDKDKRTFCIMIILLSYLNNCDIDKFNKNILYKIIYKILNYLQDFINIKNYL